MPEKAQYGCPVEGCVGAGQRIVVAGGRVKRLLPQRLLPIPIPKADERGARGKTAVAHLARVRSPQTISATGSYPRSGPNAGNPRKIFAAPGGHCHFLTWSLDGRFIYFAKGTPTTDMDIWRIPARGGNAEQITFHHAWVSYPAWLDARTLIYSATADDGSGRRLYATDVEHRIPHRVSSGIAEQYLSVAVDQVQPRHLVATVANPTAGLWTVPIGN